MRLFNAIKRSVGKNVKKEEPTLPQKTLCWGVTRTPITAELIEETYFSEEADDFFSNSDALQLKLELFNSLQDASNAIQESSARYRDQGYVLEFGYTQDELKQLAKEKNFSKSAIRAVQCSEHVDVLFERQTSDKITGMENPNFDEHLLNSADKPYPSS